MRSHTFKSWNAYNAANTKIYKFDNQSFNSSIKRIKNLKEHILNLSTTIPKWIKSNIILKEIGNVKKQYATLLKERNKSTNKIRQNWGSLSEEFKDFRIELEKTTKDYEIYKLK